MSVAEAYAKWNWAREYLGICVAEANDFPYPERDEDVIDAQKELIKVQQDLRALLKPEQLVRFDDLNTQAWANRSELHAALAKKKALQKQRDEFEMEVCRKE